MNPDSLTLMPDSTLTAGKADVDSTAIILKNDYSINVFATAFRAFISLLIIIFLIVITVYIIKKFLCSKRNHSHFSEAVKVLGTVPLSPKNSICLVKMVDQILVVGSTETNISLLTVIQDEKSLDKLNSQPAAKSQTKMSFRDYLEIFKKQD